jgi:hypothetical protein
MRPFVVIESPYAGDVKQNRAYLEICIRDSVYRGESPYASHKMLTDALDDDIPEERDLGIACGLELRRRCDLRAFYIDLGWSGGMLAAKKLYDAEGLSYETREIGSVPPSDVVDA